MKNEVQISVDLSNLMAGKIGKEHGLTDAEWKSARKNATRVINECLARFGADDVGFMKLPCHTQYLHDIQALAEKHRYRWENLLIFGIGGSALGVSLLFDALCHPYHNHIDSELRNHVPRLFVVDNIDPELISGLKPVINPKKTLSCIITKSGGTVETWGNYFQYATVFNQTPDSGQVIAITDPETGFLRKFAEIQGWDILPIPSDVGGRFSVLTPVGLFPAAILNIDIVRLMDGARTMHDRCVSTDFDQNPALQLATASWSFMTSKKKPISVMMPYANSLASFSDWYRQLWAESLGKMVNTEGKTVFAGQTPVNALGATDQHSQIQLYREGPNDKVITFLHVDSFRFGGPMNNAPEETPLEHLRLLDTAEILGIELIGTRDALTESRRPNLTVKIPAVTPYCMGQLIYLYEMVTYLTGLLLQINPFDQPGVEAGKINAKKMIRELYETRSQASDKN
ncbi:glucose-6-phosphate isomerase [bacterium]|nr:glucose-6-phosphate isomerase [candidate division CSSED10-310 bacterium]